MCANFKCHCDGRRNDMLLQASWIKSSGSKVGRRGGYTCGKRRQSKVRLVVCVL
jgi:hypothetical protein